MKQNYRKMTINYWVPYPEGPLTPPDDPKPDPPEYDDYGCEKAERENDLGE